MWIFKIQFCKVLKEFCQPDYWWKENRFCLNVEDKFEKIIYQDRVITNIIKVTYTMQDIQNNVQEVRKKIRNEVSQECCADNSTIPVTSLTRANLKLPSYMKDYYFNVTIFWYLFVQAWALLFHFMFSKK